MASFITALNIWSSNGIFDVALPLLLFFAIIFSILNRTKILGENKAIDAVVAFIISMFIIINPFTAPFLAEIFSKTGIALIIGLSVLIVLGLFTEKKDAEGLLKGIGIIGGAIFFLWIILLLNDNYAIYTWFPIGYYGISWTEVLVVIGVFAIAGYIVAKTGKSNTGEE